jgi:DNA-binding transcriptional LysR family regulator
MPPPRPRARPAVVRGRARINVDPFFARLVLAPRLGKFLADYPELSVEIAGRDRLGDLVADGFDAAVRFGEPEPSLVARRLLETRVLTCAAPPTWPSTAARRIPAVSARDGTNAFTTLTPSPAGRFTGNFTAAGRNCGSRFLAA